MKKIGKKFSIVLPPDLLKKVDDEAQKENRPRNEFIRRILDRYIREVEFRGQLDPEARESIRKNKELLHMLRNS